MSESWQYVGSQAAIEFFNSCKARERQRLLQAMNGLIADPFIKPQANSIDQTGRPTSVLWLDGFEIVYWLDHFVREVRVIEIGKI